MRTTTNIPVSLCEYALVNRKVNQLKLFMYLKLHCDGYIEEDINKWSKQIGIQVKTVKSSLKWLIKNRWITVNSKRNVLHVISYERLTSKLKMKVNTGILIDLKTEVDYQNFRALCCAVIITYYVRRKRYFDRRSERIYGGSKKNRSGVKGFYPMPNGYLAKCLHLSTSTAFRIKQEAEKARFIETKKDYVFLETFDGARVSKDKFDLIRKVELKEGHPDKVRKGQKYIKYVSSDLISSIFQCKKKRF